MDELDRAVLLGRLGLSTEALGPPEEWAPTDRTTYQQRHARFWGVITHLLEDDPRDYDQLPDWMTEDGSFKLERNA